MTLHWFLNVDVVADVGQTPGPQVALHGPCRGLALSPPPPPHGPGPFLHDAAQVGECGLLLVTVALKVIVNLDIDMKIIFYFCCCEFLKLKANASQIIFGAY